MVAGGRSALADPVVSPDTTVGVVPPPVATDCTGAGWLVGMLALTTVPQEACTGALDGNHVAGKDDRTIGAMSRAICTMEIRLLFGKAMSSG